MAPEAAATVSLKRETQLAMYRRATRTLPGGSDVSIFADSFHAALEARAQGAGA